MARRRLAPTLALAVALGAAGCGGSSGGDRPARPDPGAGSAKGHAARAADVRVIRGWVDTLRAGRVTAAAGYFAVPAVVQNGTPPIRLRTRAEVRAFNRSLPCGAKLERTVAAGPAALRGAPAGGSEPPVAGKLTTTLTRHRPFRTVAPWAS